MTKSVPHPAAQTDQLPRNRSQRTPTCQWCGNEMAVSTRGRPRKFCSSSCKQRDYEQRHNIVGTAIPANAVILHPDRAAALRDGLFELRCCAEDIATAVHEGATGAELTPLCDELVSLARRLEELR